MNVLAARKIFPLANRLQEALQIAQNDVMLYSEVLLAFREAREKENFSKEMNQEMDQLLSSLSIGK